jgi:hypothetical protein
VFGSAFRLFSISFSSVGIKVGAKEAGTSKGFMGAAIIITNLN